jgi:Rrf2 family protein
MQYSVGVEYALHSLFYMVELPMQNVIDIKALAKLHNISETYLSKIFTKLRKSGVIRSTSGVKGGYQLARPADEISFWDIIEAVEGESSLFQCAEIRQNNILYSEVVTTKNCPCLIKVVMSDAEEQMRNYLRCKSLGWLYQEIYSNYSDQKKQSISTWLDENMK